jgi:hypothetical protein
MVWDSICVSRFPVSSAASYLLDMKERGITSVAIVTRKGRFIVNPLMLTLPPLIALLFNCYSIVITLPPLLCPLSKDGPSLLCTKMARGEL